MIAQRFRTIGSAAGVAGAALAFYLVSQWVAADRAALDKVDHQIASTQRDIRMLSMELDARGRMGQLEHWNSMVWRLSAPKPRQFLGSELQLASLNRPVAPRVDQAIAAAQGPAQTVAYTPTPVPSSDLAQPTAATEQPVLRQASFVRVKPEPITSPIPTPDPPTLRRVSLLPDDIGRLAAGEARPASGGAKRGGQ